MTGVAYRPTLRSDARGATVTHELQGAKGRWLVRGDPQRTRALSESLLVYERLIGACGWFPRLFGRPGAGDDLRRPSPELETELAAPWGMIPPRLALYPLFWFLCHIAWIEEGRFGYTGRRLADLFLKGGRSSTREAQTRNLLRRTGGLAPVRGRVSVFTDCPLARAWWRHRVAVQVEEASDGRVNRATV